MKKLNIREMRASLGQLAELVAAEGELLISRLVSDWRVPAWITGDNPPAHLYIFEVGDYSKWLPYNTQE